MFLVIIVYSFYHFGTNITWVQVKLGLDSLSNVIIPSKPAHFERIKIKEKILQGPKLKFIHFIETKKYLNLIFMNSYFFVQSD